MRGQFGVIHRCHCVSRCAVLIRRLWVRSLIGCAYRMGRIGICNLNGVRQSFHSDESPSEITYLRVPTALRT